MADLVNQEFQNLIDLITQKSEKVQTIETKAVDKTRKSIEKFITQNKKIFGFTNDYFVFNFNEYVYDVAKKEFVGVLTLTDLNNISKIMKAKLLSVLGPLENKEKELELISNWYDET